MASGKDLKVDVSGAAIELKKIGFDIAKELYFLERDELRFQYRMGTDN